MSWQRDDASSNPSPDMRSESPAGVQWLRAVSREIGWLVKGIVVYLGLGTSTLWRRLSRRRHIDASRVDRRTSHESLERAVAGVSVLEARRDTRVHDSARRRRGVRGAAATPRRRHPPGLSASVASLDRVILRDGTELVVPVRIVTPDIVVVGHRVLPRGNVSRIVFLAESLPRGLTPSGADQVLLRNSEVRSGRLEIVNSVRHRPEWQTDQQGRSCGDPIRRDSLIAGISK